MEPETEKQQCVKKGNTGYTSALLQLLYGVYTSALPQLVPEGIAVST